MSLLQKRLVRDGSRFRANNLEIYETNISNSPSQRGSPRDDRAGSHRVPLKDAFSSWRPVNFRAVLPVTKSPAFHKMSSLLAQKQAGSMSPSFCYSFDNGISAWPIISAIVAVIRLVRSDRSENHRRQSQQSRLELAASQRRLFIVWHLRLKLNLSVRGQSGTSRKSAGWRKRTTPSLHAFETNRPIVLERHFDDAIRLIIADY